MSADNPEDAAALVEKLGLGYPVVSDTRLEFTQAFGVRQEGKDIPVPATFVLDAERKVRWRFVSGGIVQRASLDDALEALAR